jgi:hypothetical protein
MPRAYSAGRFRCFGALPVVLSLPARGAFRT